MQYGRLHWFVPGELDEEQRAYYDRLLSGPRDPKGVVDDSGRLIGAFNARLLDPPTGTAIQELGAALRFGTVLTGRQREIAILTVAQAEQCSYEWNAHAEVARRAGLTEPELDALRTGAGPGAGPPKEYLTWKVAGILATQGDLTDEDYAEATGVLGERALFALVSLVGHYRHTAMAIRVWRVPLREGDAEAFGA
jgi:4-carboxymuconolactone decarboxylase